MLLEEIILLLESEDLKKEVQKIAIKSTNMDISFRNNGNNEMYIVVDGAFKGKQGADDLELNKILKKVEFDIESEEHPTERMYDSREDGEHPTGIQIFSKKSNGAKYPVLRIKFIKKSIPRSKNDGDAKTEYIKNKITSISDKPGERNEIHFVSIMNKKIKEFGGMIKEVVFKSFANDKELIFTNIVGVKWVGNKNDKTDVLLFNDDGEIKKLSLKQRNFFEIQAGEGFINKNRDKIDQYIDKALDSNQLKINQEGKFSKQKHFEIAVKLSTTEAKEAYFGKDNNQVDGVIIETFLENDFKIIGTRLLISCDYVLISTSDIHDRIWPFMSINSDFEKNLKHSKPIRGKIFLSIIPRFRLKTHARKSTNYPKTLIIS